ncbi:MAG TPA: glycine oxidase ThiO [Pyrinomonadaceae bacterium]|jgi:glycine oxidase|nr:glycine oxidase ThiO [Pyrinomonadaceae bacterium]
MNVSLMAQTLTSEVLIVGGGVIGLAIARKLHRRGVNDITIIDKGTCGHEASWAAAGMLSPQAETDEAGPFLDLCLRSRDLYPQFADELLNEAGVDIELDRKGTLALAFDDDDGRRLLDRLHWQRDAGLDVETMSAEEIIKLEPNLSALIQFGVYFPNDWQVENRRLIEALRRYAEINGIRVLENTAVDRLIVDDIRVIGATTANSAIHAGSTILATGAWTSLIKMGDAAMPVKIEPVRGQIVCLQSRPGLLEHVICTHRGYLVPRRDGRILAGSTSENVGFDASTTSEALTSLTEMVKKIVPAEPLEIIDHWGGLRPFAADGLPLLGGLSGLDGLMVATAHYRNGILLAPLTAAIVADKLIDGIEDTAFTTFGLDRFSLAASTLA